MERDSRAAGRPGQRRKSGAGRNVHSACGQLRLRAFRPDAARRPEPKASGLKPSHKSALVAPPAGVPLWWEGLQARCLPIRCRAATRAESLGLKHSHKSALVAPPAETPLSWEGLQARRLPIRCRAATRAESVGAEAPPTKARWPRRWSGKPLLWEGLQARRLPIRRRAATRTVSLGAEALPPR
ncbi:DUF6053 domain-containing protein [Lysobacter yananisis]|uniref:DUF6053 domain-containing protein n=1 Tax=Lysobacter yananisis TaxID=1003114 RepID=UPI003CE48975